MDRFKHSASVVLMAAALLVTFRGCKHHDDAIETQEMSPVLKDNENDKITVDTKTGRVERTTRKAANAVGKTNSGFTTTRHLDGARKLAITVARNGSVQVYAQTKGLTFEPGIGVVYNGRPNLSADIQLGYWRRYGLNAGVYGAPGRQLSAFVGGSYNFYHNTSLLIGVDNHHNPIIGLRIGF